MKNRRQDFRYALKPKSYWKATFRAIEGANTFSAEIVNLSVGGFCVKLEPGHSATGEKWVVTIELSTQAAPLRVPVERIHPDGAEQGYWGFRFLPLPNALEQEAQDRLISRFILEGQRRDRREAEKQG
jgi:c-di-GMP-binding flagellar brake protein YcgR